MHNKATIFFLYSIICLFYFLQYPIAGSLTGDLDSIANLAMFKHLKIFIDSFFNGEAILNFCFPSKHIWFLYGADFGSGIIHIFFNYIGFNDLWANYLYISTLFTLNCFTLFLLINHLIDSKKWIAFLSAFIFCFSHFTLANLENPNVLIFFPSFSSLIFLLKFKLSASKKDIIISILIGGMLIYLSPTNFVMHIVLWTIFFFGLGLDSALFSKLKLFFFAAVLYFILVIPYVWFFIFKIYNIDVYNLISNENLAFGTSMHLNNLFNALPEHIYNNNSLDIGYTWLSKIKSAYLGVAFYFTLFYSFLLLRKDVYIKTLIIIGLIIAIGPYFVINFKIISPSFMYPFFEYLHFDNYIRVPIRYFFISIFAATILIAKLFNHLYSNGKGAWVIMLFCLIIIENVPLKMEKYSERQEIVLNPPTSTFELIKNKDTWNSILFLPSSLFNYEGDRQEYIYMYWQTLFKKNIVNGNLAMIPKERMILKELIDSFDKKNLNLILNNYPIDAIVYVKEFADSSNVGSLQVLMESSELVSKVLENDKMVVFEKK